MSIYPPDGDDEQDEESERRHNRQVTVNVMLRVGAVCVVILYLQYRAISATPVPAGHGSHEVFFAPQATTTARHSRP